MAKPPRKVDYEDVDDVIGIAAEMMDADAERLSAEELREVAADLAIPEEYLAPAVDELRRRRQALLDAEAARRKTRSRVLWGVGAAAGLVVIWVLASWFGLRGDLAEIDRQRSQVVNVLERQQATTARWQAAADGPDRHAELDGAEARVRVERRRYDDLAAGYNASAAGFPGVLAVGLFGLPEAVPLSREVATW